MKIRLLNYIIVHWNVGLFYKEEPHNINKAKKKNTCVSCCMSNKNRVGR